LKIPRGFACDEQFSDVGLLAWLVLHPIAGAFNDDGFGMMQEAVEHRGGNGAVVVEDRGPLLEGLVGG